MACVSPVSSLRGMMPEAQNPAQVQGLDPHCWVRKIRRLTGEALDSLAHSCPLQAPGHCSGLGAQRADPGDTGHSVRPENSSQPTGLQDGGPRPSGGPDTGQSASTESGAHEDPGFQGKAICGPTKTQRIFSFTFGVSQEGVGAFP